MITDAQDTPLAIILTAANVNDITQLLPLAETITAVKGRRGRSKFRPARVQHGDRGYDSDTRRGLLIQRGIEPVLTRHFMGNGIGLG